MRSCSPFRPSSTCCWSVWSFGLSSPSWASSSLVASSTSALTTKRPRAIHHSSPTPRPTAWAANWPEQIRPFISTTSITPIWHFSKSLPLKFRFQIESVGWLLNWARRRLRVGWRSWLTLSTSVASICSSRTKPTCGHISTLSSLSSAATSSRSTSSLVSSLTTSTCSRKGSVQLFCLKFHFEPVEIWKYSMIDYYSTRVDCLKCSCRRARSITTRPLRNWAGRSRARWSGVPWILIWPSFTTFPCRDGLRSPSSSWSSSTWSSWASSITASRPSSLTSWSCATISSPPCSPWEVGTSYRMIVCFVLFVCVWCVRNVTQRLTHKHVWHGKHRVLNQFWR